MGGADAILTYYVDSLDDLRRLLEDPEYQTKGRVKEKGWMDPSKGEIRVGWETTYIEKGQVVNT